MRKLSIGIVIESLHMHGGVERRTSELVRHLISAGHEVDIYANRWDESTLEGVGFHRIPMLKLGRSMKPLSFARFCSALIPKSKHDIIHTQTRIFRYDVATLGVGCHRAYLDAVCIDPETAPDKGFHRAVLRIESEMLGPEKFAAKNRIIVNSNMCKQELMERYSVPEASIHVVHNGVDHEAFSPDIRMNLRAEARKSLGLSQDDIAVLYVGAGFHRKGLDTLIEAIGQLDKQFKLLIVGKGNRDAYNDSAHGLGIADQLIWAGQSDDVTRHYAAADVFVLPTRYDPFANSTLEALACGVPVITTTSNGVSEILRDGIDGFIVERDSPQDIAERLLALADDENLRERIGSAGHKAVEPYTWQRTAEQTMAVYDAIIADRGAA